MNALAKPTKTPRQKSESADVRMNAAIHATVIESLGVYLPPRAVTTAEVTQGCDRPVTFPIEQMTGIHARRMAGDGEYAIDLARRAVANCLTTSQHKPADMDVVICCNISHYDGPGHRFSYEPCTAQVLKYEFGFERAIAFDVSNACAGMFTAIYLIDAMIQGGLIRRGMAVSGEYITHLTRTAQREIESYFDPRMACLTVGDAGAAVILEAASSPGVGFEAIGAYTLGAHSRHCTAKATDRAHGGAIMLTNPVPMTAVALKHGTMHLARTLQTHGWQDKRIDHMILHQTSEMAIRGAVRELSTALGENICRVDNTIINVCERGNTATTTHLLALYENIMSGRVKDGDRIVFGISGSGQTVGTALYTLDDLPSRLRDDGAIPRTYPANRDRSEPRARRGTKVRIESLGIPRNRLTTKAESLSLASDAAADCFDHSSYERSSVDLLIFTGTYRSEFLSEPAIAALLAGELGVNADVTTPEDPTTLAFDLINGGVGFLNACHMASGLIEDGERRVALVVSSEVENNRPEGPRGLIGVAETGSAALLDVSSDGIEGFEAFRFKSFPWYQDRLVTYTEMCEGQLVVSALRDPELSRIYRECVVETVREFLESEGVAMSEIDLIIPQHVEPGFVAELARGLAVEPEKCVDLATDQNDWLSASLVHSLEHVVGSGLATRGQLALLIAVGSGLQVGCALYRF